MPRWAEPRVIQYSSSFVHCVSDYFPGTPILTTLVVSTLFTQYTKSAIHSMLTWLLLLFDASCYLVCLFLIVKFQKITLQII